MAHPPYLGRDLRHRYRQSDCDPAEDNSDDDRAGVCHRAYEVIPTVLTSLISNNPDRRGWLNLEPSSIASDVNIRLRLCDRIGIGSAGGKALIRPVHVGPYRDSQPVWFGMSLPAVHGTVGCLPHARSNGSP